MVKQKCFFTFVSYHTKFQTVNKKTITDALYLNWVPAILYAITERYGYIGFKHVKSKNGHCTFQWPSTKSIRDNNIKTFIEGFEAGYFAAVKNVVQIPDAGVKRRTAG